MSNEVSKNLLVTDEPKTHLTVIEQAKEAGWPEHDCDWLSKAVSQNFQPIALKYGRLCFSLVMQAGVMSAAFGVIHQAVGFCASKHIKQKGGTGIQQAMAISNDFLVRIMADHQIKQETFAACKAEIEQIGLLSGGTETPSGGGRIILPN